MNRPTVTDIDAYIAEFPPEVQRVLQEVRSIIGATAPNATERISYAMPTFDLNGSHLIHFAAFKTHLGIYPTPSGIEAFREELTPFKNAKGSVQFPLDQPLPADLIRRIVEFRVKESQPTSDLPKGLSKPALRALAQAGYARLEQIAQARESDLLRLHGMGPKAIGQLRGALAARGQSFASEG
jgi:uncharacterized protein YdhG (YjbR/CyaY superfamily)